MNARAVFSASTQWLQRGLAFVGAAALGAALLGAGRPSSAQEFDHEAPVELPTTEIRDNALCSFGIGLVARGDVRTQAIARLFITDVWEKSDAEKQGLKPGDEILSINGVKVSAMKGGMKRGSDLFELLINRPPGAQIRVEVRVHTVKRMTLVAG